jgi:23S rRNA (uracil1939-C5)-methyltransferase
MKRENKFRTFQLDIDKLVYGGMGIGRHEGKIIFVPFSIPGDRLLVRLVEEKKNFNRADIVQILKPGSGRATPVCPHFEKCGGCHWQQLDYLQQVEAKRQILEEVFHHRFPETRDLPILMRACPQPFGYRSRARVQTRGTRSAASVGFFRSGSHAIEDVESCPLFRPALNEALHSLRQFKFRVDPDPTPQEWDIACSEEEHAWAATHTGSLPADGISSLLKTERSEEIILKRKIREFHYSATASVFFQANDFMISELVGFAQESAKNAGANSALDLFAGGGLFSLPLARYSKKVVAVESSPSSCRLCSANASAAGFSHIQVVCADVSAWMESESASSPQFDLIVLDPPRTGAGAGVMEHIRKWAPQTILYVSCDPQTLSRDLARLTPGGYRIDLVEGLDLFPQTYHFETVVRLIKHP